MIGAIPSTPATITLRSTTLRLVGAYAPWFSNQPSSCLEVVQFVVKGLEETALAPAASRALVNLCDSSRKDLVQHVGAFVQILGNLEGKLEVSTPCYQTRRC